MSIEEVNTFIKQGYEIQSTAKQMCVDLLSNGTEFPNHSIEFHEGCEPSIASSQFDDDLCDAFITRLYVEDGVLKADIHAYYISEDLEGVDLEDECGIKADLHAYYISEDLEGVDLEDECGIEYLDILDHMWLNGEDVTGDDAKAFDTLCEQIVELE